MNPLVPDAFDVFGIVLVVVIALVLIGAVVWTVNLANRRKTSTPVSSDRTGNEPELHQRRSSRDSPSAD